MFMLGFMMIAMDIYVYIHIIRTETEQLCT